MKLKLKYFIRWVNHSNRAPPKIKLVQCYMILLLYLSTSNGTKSFNIKHPFTAVDPTHTACIAAGPFTIWQFSIPTFFQGFFCLNSRLIHSTKLELEGSIASLKLSNCQSVLPYRTATFVLRTATLCLQNHNATCSPVGAELIL